MRIPVLFALPLACMLVGCNSKKQADQPPPQLQQAQQVDPATAANVSGVVKFVGSAPSPQKIDMSQDPSCGTTPAYDESLVVNNGDLANVLVYVKNGPRLQGSGSGGRPPIIEQRGCRYHPHVLAVRTGETVQIVNADDTTHNIHPMPTQSKQWNESQLPNTEPITKKFDKPELMIPIKCNQHAWMRMYLNVLDTPFFAVTGEDGKFDLKGLPAGDYTLAAVHEKLGEQEIKIILGPKDSKSAEFSFKAP